jgi:MFS family permease
MLDNAGITNSTTQLEIVGLDFNINFQQKLISISKNIILNAWCLVCSIFGTYLADRMGRKSLGILSQTLLTIFLFLVGALTKSKPTPQNSIN